MGLHDTDKGGLHRKNPSPNADDGVAQRMAHKTISTSYKSASEPQKQRVAFDQDAIRAFDNNNNVSAYFGYDPEISETPVFRIAEAGFDAQTTDESHLIFNSEQNVFKVVKSDTISLTYDGSVGTYATAPHGLTTIPIVMAYVKLPDDADFSPMGGEYVPMPAYSNRTGLPFFQCIQSADETNIYFRVHDIYSSGGSPKTYQFRYYVLQETAN